MMDGNTWYYQDLNKLIEISFIVPKKSSQYVYCLDVLDSSKWQKRENKSLENDIKKIYFRIQMTQKRTEKESKESNLLLRKCTDKGYSMLTAPSKRLLVTDM